MWKQVSHKDLKVNDRFGRGNNFISDLPEPYYQHYPIKIAKLTKNKDDTITITTSAGQCHTVTKYTICYIWVGPKGIPVTYKISETCRNCKHVFIRKERKAPTEYYCHQDESDRPLCGSILMGESEINPGFSWAQWENWRAEHFIEDELGKCRLWKKGTE